MRAFIGIILVLTAITLAAMPAHALAEPGMHTCVIATNNGGLEDYDCDRTPDVYDNCPFVVNPDQVDSDSNGIGDACDLVIDEIRLDPETPMQGRSMLATISVFNARPYPMRNLVVRMEVPTLGVANDEQIALINPGERIQREVVVRVPECAPLKLTDVVIYVEYPFAPGQKEVFTRALKVPVVPSGTCAGGEKDDKTVINIIEMQDVNSQTGALYPFTIHNNQAESKAYVLSVDNHDWGSAEINPGTVIVVPPGESRDGAIQVWAYSGMSGQKSMLFTVQARDDMKQIMLLANIPQPAQPSVNPSMQLLLGIVGFVGILVLIVLAVLFVKKGKSKPVHHKK